MKPILLPEESGVRLERNYRFIHFLFPVHHFGFKHYNIIRLLLAYFAYTLYSGPGRHSSNIQTKISVCLKD
jgi:hypothetical protein